MLERSSLFKKTPQTGASGVILVVFIGVVLACLGVILWWLLTQTPASNMENNNALNAEQTDTQANSNTTNVNNNSNLTTNTETNVNISVNTNVPPAPTPAEPTEPTESPSSSSCPDAGACNADAQTYCPDEWKGTSVEASWKLDLVNCLYDEHKNDISAECRESLECRQQLNENLLAACEEDKRTFCASTRPSPGSEPLVDCLGDHFSQLSADCQAAWTAHDAAKPE